MTDLGHYAHIWLAQVRYTVMRELMFKSNFISLDPIDLARLYLHLSFVQFLYLQVNEIAGWGKWEMILLVTTNMLVQQIFQMFLMINLTKLPELIRTGKLDFFLAQPLWRNSYQHPPFRAWVPVINTLVSGIVCGVAIAHLRMSFSLFGLLAFPLLVIFGVLIHYALLMMLMSMAFWMTRAQGFINAYYNVFQIARLPREAFKGITRFAFTWGLPLLLIANVPARTLLYGMNEFEIAQMGLATATCSR